MLVLSSQLHLFVQMGSFPQISLPKALEHFSCLQNVPHAPTISFMKLRYKIRSQMILIFGYPD